MIVYSKWRADFQKLMKKEVLSSFASFYKENGGVTVPKWALKITPDRAETGMDTKAPFLKFFRENHPAPV